MGKIFSFIFHSVVMILFIIVAKDIDLIYFALMAEGMSIYFKV